MAKLSDEELRKAAKEFLYKYPHPRCLGYPHCDGDLPGEPHIDYCPIEKDKRPKPVDIMADFAAEILKRMGKVDVAGIAAKCVELAEREFNEAIEEAVENPTSLVYDIRVSDFETILRSHLEGKSE